MEQKISDLKNEEKIIRIMSKDIRGNMNVYVGLTKIKGISWSFSNALCKVLKIDKSKKIGDLSEGEMKKIVDFIKNPKIKPYIVNRRVDLATGEDNHLTGSDLELKKEFDIKRLKKIRSYKGYRHALNLPVKGQRTKGHFRKNKAKGVGIRKKKK